MKPKTILTVYIVTVWSFLAFIEAGIVGLDFIFLCVFLYVWYARLPKTIRARFD